MWKLRCLYGKYYMKDAMCLVIPEKMRRNYAPVLRCIKRQNDC